jgi:hypothetical protein
VSGPVPDNAQLVLDVYSTSTIICTPAYSQPLTTLSSNISLGNVTVTPNASWAQVDGTVTDCNNNPVTNGYIIVMINNSYYSWYYLNNGNHFNFYHPLCNTNSIQMDLVALDIPNQQQSNNSTFTISSGNNNIGNIIACGITSQEFFNYSVNSSNYSITDTVYQFASGNTMHINAWAALNTNSAGTEFDRQNITVNSLQNLNSFYSLQTGQTTITNPISVHITEYGNIGQFISGNFTGTVTGTAPPNTTYNITCNFRVRRNN